MNDQDRVLELASKAGKKGVTVEEVEKKLRLRGKASGLIRELALGNGLVDSGKRRKNSQGHKTVVWVTAKHGEIRERTPNKRVSKENAMHIKNLDKDDLDRALNMCKALSLFATSEVALTLAADDEAKVEGLLLCAQSGGCTVRSLLPGKIEETGTLLVDLDHLLSLKLFGSKSSFRLRDDKVEIRSGRAAYKVSQQKGKPQIVGIPKPERDTVQITAGLVSSALKTIWFKHDDSGSGDVRLGWGRGRFRMETADEFRGVVFDRAMPVWSDVPVNMTVMPKKILEAILTCFPKEELVYIDVTKSAIRMYSDISYVSVPRVTASGLVKVSKVISEQTKRLKTCTSSMRLESRDFAELTKAAASVIQDSEKYAVARVYIVVEDGKLGFRTDGDIGSFQTRIPVEEMKGKNVKACVLCRALKDLANLAANASEDGVRFEVWRKELIILRNTGKNFKTTFCIPQLQTG